MIMQLAFSQMCVSVTRATLGTVNWVGLVVSLTAAKYLEAAVTQKHCVLPHPSAFAIVDTKAMAQVVGQVALQFAMGYQAGAVPKTHPVSPPMFASALLAMLVCCSLHFPFASAFLCTL